MALPLIMAGLSAAVGAIAGAIGKALSAGDYEKARKLREDAIAEYGDDILPVLDKVMAQEVGDTEYGKITEDAKQRGRQDIAADELMNAYQQEGNTAADRAAMALAQQTTAARADSDYQSIRQNMARRGVQNSGLELALQSQSGQDAANSLGSMAAQNAIAARQRALQSLMGSADISRGVRADDYRLAGARAGAQDAINQFNATERGRAADQNNRNQLAQFGAQMDLKNARNQARYNAARGYEGSAERTEDTAAAIGGAGQDVLDAASNYYGDKKKKGG